MAVNATYDTGGGGSPVASAAIPNATTAQIVTPNQERVYLGVCVPGGQKVLLQPLGTNNNTTGLCVQNGDTKELVARTHGAFVALGWQIRNDSGVDVNATVLELFLPGWRYPSRYGEHPAE